MLGRGLKGSGFQSPWGQEPFLVEFASSSSVFISLSSLASSHSSKTYIWGIGSGCDLRFEYAFNSCLSYTLTLSSAGDLSGVYPKAAGVADL